MHQTGGIQGVQAGWTSHGKVYPFAFHSQKVPEGAVTCRSPLEERIFRALDRNRAVLAFEVRPVRVPCQVGQTARLFTPDLLVHYVDGRKVLVAVRTARTVPDGAEQAVFRAAADYAAAHGMAFEVWSGPPPAGAMDRGGGRGELDIGTAARLQAEAAGTGQLPRRAQAGGSLTFWALVALFGALAVLIHLAR